MKLEIDWDGIKNGDSPVEITKNNGKHVSWVTAAEVKAALNDHGKQVVIKANCKRFGFDRQYIINFLKEHAPDPEISELRGSQFWFNALRKGNEK